MTEPEYYYQCGHCDSTYFKYLENCEFCGSSDMWKMELDDKRWVQPMKDKDVR